MWKQNYYLASVLWPQWINRYINQLSLKVDLIYLWLGVVSLQCKQQFLMAALCEFLTWNCRASSHDRCGGANYKLI